MSKINNQRTIKVKRSTESVKKDYFKISNRNLQIAMLNLKPNTFKLYCYLADNANGYELNLYPCDFEKVANVSYDTYKRSFEELVEKGFLLRHKDNNNLFLFTEESESNELLDPEKRWDKIESVSEEEFYYEKSKNFASNDSQNLNIKPQNLNV